MSNLRIIHDNAADRAVLAASSQAGTLGPANLQRERKSAVLRSVGPFLEITATLPLGEIVGGVVLPFCNLTASALIRVRGYAAPGDATPVFDTGAVLACAYAPLGAWDFGATALAVNAFSFGGGTYARVWFPRTTARHFFIELADPDNPAGYIECSRLVLGNYWEPENNASYGASVTPVDTSTQYRKGSGEQGVEAGSAYRKLTLALEHMTPLDRASAWRLVRGSGKRRPILVSLFPDDADPELEQAHQLYGRLAELAAISTPYFQTYATSLDIEEL
ncbi:hypothetical protein SAMN05216517_106105 [Janthinobacterium sp. OK676]|uniref:hypothetical protein n=1 Tax=Janthinobacterium sp. OK676 TaxID=1855295 RepID=UPI00087F44FE|nr:hypothetical protein [Janthinobacterium sp. OK676]SDM77275.1 hypothetical protein SAMN05216517_106105 [Janthinobacterium sp. OK676]